MWDSGKAMITGCIMHCFAILFWMLLDLAPEEAQDFPISDGPVPRETRLVYATAYLQRKYELKGHDPADVKQEEIEAFLLEMELMDIVSTFHKINS